MVPDFFALTPMLEITNACNGRLAWWLWLSYVPTARATLRWRICQELCDIDPALQLDPWQWTNIHHELLELKVAEAHANPVRAST